MGCAILASGKVIGTVCLGLAAGSSITAGYFGIPAVATAAVHAGQDSGPAVRALYTKIKRCLVGPFLSLGSVLLAGIFAISNKRSRHPYLLYASLCGAPVAIVAQWWFLCRGVKGAVVPVVSKSSNGVARKDEEEISLLDNSVYARLDAEAVSDTSSSEVAPTPPAEPVAVQADDSYVKRVSNTMLVASVASTLSFVIATIGIYGDH